MPSPVCWLCKVPGSQFCPDCPVAACSDGHLGAHYSRVDKVEEEKCRPVRVEWREGAGNCLVSTRPIKAGEEILRDVPALVSPSLVSSPVCLGCLKNWKGNCLCEICQFPVCSKKCAGSPNHKQECEILSRLPTKPKFSPDERSNPALALIGVIRYLNLVATNEEVGDRLNLLMDHVDDIQANPELSNMWEGTAVHNLVNQLPDSPYTKQGVLRAVGVLHTNSVSGMGNGHALYPTFSLINHSCVCNSRFQIYPDRSILLRAQVDIAEGEEITTQYLTPFLGTLARRKKIRKNWFFDCACERCADPTEKATNLSGIVCKKCQGTVLQKNPLDNEGPWGCSGCPEELSAATIQVVLDSLQTDLDSVDPNDVKALEEKIVTWSQIVTPHHYLMLQLKRNLLGSLKLASDKDQRIAPRIKLRKMIELAEENMQVFDKVDPGLTILRGRMLQYINGPKLQIAKMDMQCGKINRPEFLRAAVESIQIVKAATQCFEAYDLPEF